MARAFLFAEGDGPMPHEIEAARLIAHFGAEAVYGRPLFVRELYRILAARRIEEGYSAWTQAENAAVWAEQNPEQHQLLVRAALLANRDLGNIRRRAKAE